MPADGFPRVLLLCDEPINTISGGGVTMGTLFRGWPKESLGQVWAHHRFEMDETVCSNYLRLGAHKMPGDRWAPDLLRRQRKLIKSLRGILRPGVRLDYARVLEWARAFDPDVIYSQATPYPMYTWWLPRWLARDLNVPLVNHIMDDWPAAMRFEWLPIHRHIMWPVLQWQLKQLFGAGVVNLAICKQMAEAFAARYGKSFLPFHNAVDLAQWANPKQSYGLRDGAFRVVYLGALAEDNQLLSLRDVAVAIGSLGQAGVNICLTVHTGEMYLGHYRQYLDGLTNVAHGGSVPRDCLCAVLAAADLLVLPVNFDPRSLAMIQYSMPTKVPEYMASAAPILVYAPAHTPVATYAREAAWGYVVTDMGQGKLEAALQALMQSEPLRESLGQRARQLALRNHDACTVREHFRDTLRRAATEVNA